MSIVLSTGDLKEPYEILDAIFALDGRKEGLLSGAIDAGKAFDGVKNKLRQICENLGGTAVINCQFEYRDGVGQGLLGSKQVLEIFAYGTAVKIKRPRDVRGRRPQAIRSRA